MLLCSWSWGLSRQSLKWPQMVGPAQTGTTQSRCECTVCQELCQHWHCSTSATQSCHPELDSLVCQALINCRCSRVAQNSPDALVIKVKVESLGGLSNTTVRGKALCQSRETFSAWNKPLRLCWLYLLAIAPTSECMLSCLTMLQVGRADVLLIEILALASSQELLREEPLFTKVHPCPFKTCH